MVRCNIQLMVVMIGLTLSPATGCKRSPEKSPTDSALATWGGKAHAFVDLPGYFVEFFTDDGSAKTHSFCSGAHIGGGYILTAAHCLDSHLSCQEDLNHVQVNFIHSSASGRREQKHPLADVHGIVLHAGWLSSSGQRHYDIALIKTGLRVVGQAYLPESPPLTQQSRISSSELWSYGTGGVFEHQSHHDQPRSRTSYFGGVVSAIDPRAGAQGSPSPLHELGDDELMRQIENHPLLTEKGREFMKRHRGKEVFGTAGSGSLYPSPSPNPSSTGGPVPAVLTTPLPAVPSEHLFGDTFITPPTDDRSPLITTYYQGPSLHPDAVVSSCPGDSGGPLIFRVGSGDSHSGDILIGINSGQRNQLNINSLEDVVMLYNLGEDVFIKGGCQGYSTELKQAVKRGLILTLQKAVSTYYHRAWIEAAKKSLEQGHHRPALACAPRRVPPTPEAATPTANPLLESR